MACDNNHGFPSFDGDEARKCCRGDGKYLILHSVRFSEIDDPMAAHSPLVRGHVFPSTLSKLDVKECDGRENRKMGFARLAQTARITQSWLPVAGSACMLQRPDGHGVQA